MSAPSNGSRTASPTQYWLPRERLQDLLAWLTNHFDQVLGPRVRDGAIVYDRITSDSELPIGYQEVSNAGSYRLARRGDASVFGFTVGPHAWRRYFQKPREELVTLRRREGTLTASVPPPDAKPTALFGVRACDLSAIAIQDRVFSRGSLNDPGYFARREQVFTVAVNCAEPAATCFCDSMKTGPVATSGYDLALTELLEPKHGFVVHAPTPRGHDVIAELALQVAEPERLAAASQQHDWARSNMGRHLQTEGLYKLLMANLESPQFDKVAERCLACTNCTLVCPTCFCTTTEDTTDLLGNARRERRYDSCFTTEHSYMHGGPVRDSIASRYRQWLTHKLATWHDQFDTTGCVGCGRCIAWCPAGIDLTEEAGAIRSLASSAGPPTAESHPNSAM